MPVHIDLPPELLGLVLAGKAGELADQALALLPADEPGGEVP